MLGRFLQGIEANRLSIEGSDGWVTLLHVHPSNIGGVGFTPPCLVLSFVPFKASLSLAGSSSHKHTSHTLRVMDRERLSERHLSNRLKKRSLIMKKKEIDAGGVCVSFEEEG